MAGARIADSLTEYNNIKKGFMTQGLTNWATTDRPAIPAGFTIEIGGSVYQFAAEEEIDLGALSGAQRLYVVITVDSADAVSAEFSTTFPATFNSALNGWYDGADRYLPYSVYWNGSATWTWKYEIVLGSFYAENIEVGNDLNVGDDLNVGGDLYVVNINATGNANITGDADVIGSIDAKEYNPKAMIASSIERTTSGSNDVPAGIYHANIAVSSTGTASGVVETYINGAWVQVTDSYKAVTAGTDTSDQFTIISDGTNTRFTVTEYGTSGVTLFLSKY